MFFKNRRHSILFLILVLLIGVVHGVQQDTPPKPVLNFEDLETTLAGCQSVYLSANITLVNTITIPSVCLNVSLIGNGHTLTIFNQFEWSWRHLFVKRDATLHIHNVTFDGRGIGGGVHFEGEANGHVQHNTFQNCLATRKPSQNSGYYYDSGSGGGIDFGDGVSGNVQHNTFHNCQATFNGGGLNFETNLKSASFSDNLFERCEAKKGGGIYVSHYVLVQSFSVNIFQNCKASQYDRGGGMYVGGFFSGSFARNTFSGCSAMNGGGLHVSADISRTSVFTDNHFHNCSATGLGGGVYMGSEMSANSFSKNIFQGCTAVRGGGMHVIGNILIPDFTDNSFENCHASKNGGGISTDRNIHHSSFSNNRFQTCTASQNGGAIQVYGSISNVHFTENVFDRCHAEEKGDVLYKYPPVDKQVIQLIEEKNGLEGCSSLSSFSGSSFSGNLLKNMEYTTLDENGLPNFYVDPQYINDKNPTPFQQGFGWSAVATPTRHNPSSPRPSHQQPDRTQLLAFLSRSSLCTTATKTFFPLCGTGTTWNETHGCTLFDRHNQTDCVVDASKYCQKDDLYNDNLKTCVRPPTTVLPASLDSSNVCTHFRANGNPDVVNGGFDSCKRILDTLKSMPFSTFIDTYKDFAISSPPPNDD